MPKYQDVDLKEIAWNTMIKYGFEPDFSKKVLKEIKGIKPDFSDIPPDVMDLRNLLWSSIDNFDSMDLDQIEYCRRNNDGSIHVKVAIADVDYYVPKNSYADQHAAYNGTSVYTGAVTFTMLPDKLSKGITSLLPDQDRLAVVIEYDVQKSGKVHYGTIYRAIVSNKAKLIYEEIGDWLFGNTPVPESVSKIPGLKEQLLLQNETAKILKKYRVKKGALLFETIEAEPVIENGKVKELAIQQQNPARSIIEELMVAANGTMAVFLGNAGLPIIERVVRIPKNWDGIVLTAANHGEKLPDTPNSKKLSEFLIRSKEADPERFPDLSLTIIKLMGPGEYVALKPDKTPIGHFALAVSDYTHSTAPNRRYADLIIQRLLKSALKNGKHAYKYYELEEKADWLTDRDALSKKVERFMQKAAAGVLLQDRIGELFDAIVTGASDKGTYVRLKEIPVEGRVMKGEKGLMVGEKIRVKLLMTDPYKGYIDFEFTGKIREPDR
ncbi:RNB domain-containing ribonuclease [Methanoplanus sp. FWC-SCC4]|uniref:RNB domain-containing ribonuclease n=1 Tax=Methanochimaera problematica TaxID=2609417 RepID=A0AA97I2E0_9EURY|nr:RNB domain-containing ribonuclease [Methanoplanus sp. FWC-SCC4]WOF16170.1 RNB domain-containing ribonuclease [Methanoplanus sp. FWC-SCC4]